MISQGHNDNGELIRDFYVEHAPVDLVCADDGLTRQEFKDECDINVLLAQYERTGVLPANRAPGEGQYLDLSDVPDLQKAFDIIQKAEAAFMTLPASVRKEFDNDAMRFVAFAEHPDHIDKMREWGLAPMPPEAPANPESQNPVPEATASK